MARPPDRPYAGVSRTPQGRFTAYVTVKGRFTTAGTYDSARDAAIARDRAALSRGLSVDLNEPEAARALGPMSPEDLRRECKLRGRRGTGSSQYMGVTYVKNHGNWAAWAPGSPSRFIGAFEQERDAAIARDRVALAESGATAQLNFPDLGEPPASLEEMRRWARELRKVHDQHRYQGARRDPNKETFCWVASIRVGPRVYSLGNWRTEREAVIAWDRAALYLKPDRALLNLPEVSTALGAASPEDLSAEAHRRFKATTSSRFRGVNWCDSNDGWVAKIIHQGQSYHLGTFHDEERAAEAYDEAAKRLHEDAAILNFPLEEAPAGRRKDRRQVRG